jgi:hypothetical protein
MSEYQLSDEETAYTNVTYNEVLGRNIFLTIDSLKILIMILLKNLTMHLLLNKIILKSPI